MLDVQEFRTCAYILRISNYLRIALNDSIEQYRAPIGTLRVTFGEYLYTVQIELTALRFRHFGLRTHGAVLV